MGWTLVVTLLFVLRVQDRKEPDETFFVGAKLEWHPPYVVDSLSQQRIRQGLHVPVKSCWNGLVAIRAAPFISEGLRFR